MKFSAKVTTYGMGSGIEMTAEEENGLTKEVWTAEYRHSHVLQVRQYILFKRETKRHNWKIINKISAFNIRNKQNVDLKMPPQPEELIKEAIRAWGEISVTDFKWNER